MDYYQFGLTETGAALVSPVPAWHEHISSHRGAHQTMSTSAYQLFLLADHLKLSLLERQRAISLNIESTRQDRHIRRSLSQFQDGIEQLESQSTDLGEAEDDTSDLARLKTQYADLYSQFHGSAPPSAEIKKPNPALASDFAAAQSRPSRTTSSLQKNNKNVRFHDNPDEHDAEAQAHRAAALFSDHQRYRDEPEAPDQSRMDNPQIHTYHKQVLREQDDQLEVLGQSIGRQRMLGIQMGNELDEQVEMLDDVERGVDRHSATLQRAQKRLGTIARKAKDNWNWVTITILMMILVLLIVVLK
ncbi:uncharacterized protein MYCFIDRAFT_178564 [Pseudocercospora fijiensis CIRAD86]|uniref:t-SNARE coiled-coil homology domain-containing protein n=1 Tax=Pseudocercospora fijiensis (strain CIRAD86) TaxID=383855 RepID=M3A200_PSEFD|nr:uncharacterized protein MYCFIDRAFT_178564 [Pseudocercospora fijiensis CIRAD86]EME78426.1 hypothetical protein MYCFIDRAFT_178564 [Pseudocercospora fijiensis CIRAD86]